jgi:rhodanese-related sulfurtransferase
MLQRDSLLVFVALLAFLAIPAASAQEDELASPKLRVDWTEFKKQYDAKAVAVVDVRGKDAYEAGHIPGASLVPLAEIEKGAPDAIERLKNLKKPIVLYCA